MYHVSLFVSFLLFSSFSWGLEIDLRHSEAVSYLHFLDTGFGEPFTSGSVREIIEKSKSRVFQEKSTINSFNNFKSYVQEGYNFRDESPNRSEGFYAEDALKSIAVNSKSLVDFESHLSIFLPYRGIESYFELKRKAYPLFSKLIWNPSLPSQEGALKKAKETIKKTEFVHWLEKAKRFYRSEYPEGLPFKVGLIPIPDINLKSKHTSGLNLRDIQVVPYFTEIGIKDDLGVVFHEFCHALYEGQPSSLKIDIDNFYLKHSDPHALFAYRYLNESLATALGNGLYDKVLNGSLNEKSWYNVNYVDQLARAYLPLIERYLKMGKGLDKKFMESTIQFAKEKFPNGPFEIDSNFIAARILIDHESIGSRVFKKALKQSFRIQSINATSPIEKGDLDELKGVQYKTGIVITSNAKKVEAQLSKVLDLSMIKNEIENKENFWAVIPRKSGYVFWINVKGANELSSLIEKIKALHTLPKDPTVLFL
ncbi:MAG: hypothetical protein KDD25_02630 [Bdellovibrionales bacterium]|nr:hypothetical protein [Bdellovibrionales bacterium]